MAASAAPHIPHPFDPLWWLADLPLEWLPFANAVHVALARYHQAMGRNPEAIKFFGGPLTRPVVHWPQLARCRVCQYVCRIDLPGERLDVEHIKAFGMEHRVFDVSHVLPWQVPAEAYERRAPPLITPTGV